jgi:hypothetical protein
LLEPAATTGDERQQVSTQGDQPESIMSENPSHFIGAQIEVHFDSPPTYQKAPTCPDAFTWNGRRYRVAVRLAEWTDFRRRGRAARNMQPAHAAVAARRGSLGVGRYYFRVQTDGGQVFELYYDRAIRDSDDRLGHWFLVSERGADGQ